jgi:hypothetical protein
MTTSLVKVILHFPIAKRKARRDPSGLDDKEIAFLRHLFLVEP